MAAYSPEIIKTLNDQVQTLAPLRDSYQKLQAYYHQLTRDVSILVTQTGQSESDLLQNLNYLQEMHHSLERQFNCCGEQLRQLECENARVEMEGKQQQAQAEALKKRELLELEQKSVLEERRREVVDQNEKITFAVAKYKEMIHNIELALKAKEYENVDVEREIKKMELVNQKINNLNHAAEQAISTTQKDCANTAEEIFQLENKLETYQKLIEAKERQNKEVAQSLISKTEELEQLKHRKQYVQKLLDTELGEQREMTRAYGELESYLAVKNDKLMFIRHQNEEYEKMIEEEKAKQLRNQEQLLKMKTYLNTLVSTNEHLYSELERSCTQDREVQVMLSDKLSKLMVVNDKITENELVQKSNVPQVPRLFQERNLSPKNLTPKGSPAKLSPLRLASPTAKDRIIEQSYVQKEMSSTWGSHSKENLYC